MSAVSDAGPIIHLSWIGRLDLLQALFGDVVVPLAVQDEMLRAGSHVPGVTSIRDALATGRISVQRTSDRLAVDAMRTELDRGESEAIVLMREVHANILLLDDRRARELAIREGLPITGTIGILRLARNRGLIPAVTPLLDELRKGGFRVSPDLVDEIRREEQALGPG